MRSLIVLLVAFVCPLQLLAQAPLKYVPAPPDNPLKGLVPYARPQADRFPHSMEFGYLPLSDLMTGPNEFDWEPLETLLDDIAARRHQTVFRIWIEYPGRDEGIPAFLQQEGLKVTQWLNTNSTSDQQYSARRVQQASRSRSAFAIPAWHPFIIRGKPGPEKGVRHQKPERPFGCFALLVPDPFSGPPT